MHAGNPNMNARTERIFNLLIQISFDAFKHVTILPENRVLDLHFSLPRRESGVQLEKLAAHVHSLLTPAYSRHILEV
jgi:hypothetical protein